MKKPALLYTLDAAASLLGRPETTIKAVADRFGLGRKPTRSWTFTADDIEALRRLIRPGPGRPRKDPTDCGRDHPQPYCGCTACTACQAAKPARPARARSARSSRPG